MSDAIPLPPRPNLEQYKKLAKDLQHACRSSDPGAIRQWAERLTQADREAARIDQRWHKHQASRKRAAQCTLTDAQFFVAREHGFTSWPKFAKHLEGLARANSPVSNFEAAADAIAGGDAAKLKKLLRDNPGLARARSTREHRSTLLHYVSANGIEDFRQTTPKNIVEITKMLLDAGADVNAESDAYGGGSTTLGLAATSLHPQQAGVQIALLQTLLDHGASLDQPSAAGNAHSVVHGCLANGQPEAAEFLASLGAPLDLEAAAGLGRLDQVKNYLDERGGLKTPATKQQVESAFLFACGYGRLDVVEFLLDCGVDPGARNDGDQTGLHWAAYGARADIVKLLLERGAPLDVRDQGYHATPLDVALYVWHTSPDREEREGCYEVVALLARAGAKLDPKQWQNPGDRGSDMVEKIRSDPRMSAAISGGAP